MQQILRIPAFHHGVRSIHRRIQRIRYGRVLDEPLNQGEATRLPSNSRVLTFLRHWRDQIREDIDIVRGRNKPPY